jgi:hypothetical protein
MFFYWFQHRPGFYCQYFAGDTRHCFCEPLGICARTVQRFAFDLAAGIGPSTALVESCLKSCSRSDGHILPC